MMEQGFEQLFAFALRAQMELGGRVRQRQQFGQEFVLIIAARRGGEQVPQLAEFLLGRVAACETGGAFELDDKWVECAVLMMGRAEIAQPYMRLILDRLRQRRGKARLADPRLARDRHHPRRISLAASAATIIRVLPRARRAALPANAAPRNG